MTRWNLPSTTPTGYSPLWGFQLKPGFELAVPDRSESLDAVDYIPAGSQQFSTANGWPKLTYAYRGY